MALGTLLVLLWRIPGLLSPAHSEPGGGDVVTGIRSSEGRIRAALWSDGAAFPEDPARAAYRRTARGRALGPVLEAMRDWGRRYR